MPDPDVLDSVKKFRKKAQSALYPKVMKEVEWEDIRNVIATSESSKEKIVEAVREQNPSVVGQVIMVLIEQLVKDRVNTEINSIMSDGSITLAEFARIFD